MSIDVLPNELIDLIVLEVGFELSLDPEERSLHSRAGSDVARLARVSKRFLHPSRDLLYQRPLLTERIPSWTAAIRLVEALTLNGRALGKTIWCLSGAGRWFEILQRSEPLSKLPYQARGYSAAFSWYLQLLRVCPRVQWADLVFNSQSQLNKVIKALTPAALNSLIGVRFVGSLLVYSPSQPSRTTMSFDLVKEALETPELESIDHLVLRNVHLDPTTSRPSPAVYNLLDSLNIEGYSINSLASCFQALPIDPTYLNDIYITTASTYPDPSFLPLLDYLTPGIKHLSVLFSSNICPPTLLGYPSPPPGPSFPLASLAKFDKLSMLVLGGFKGPSLALLAQLSQSCPLLTEIDFHESYWIDHRPNAIFVPNESYLDTIVPVDKLSTELEKFRKLCYVDLGYLPTLDEGKYVPVKKFLEGKGVEVRWEICRKLQEICSNCGDWHEEDDDW